MTVTRCHYRRYPQTATATRRTAHAVSRDGAAKDACTRRRAHRSPVGKQSPAVRGVSRFCALSTPFSNVSLRQRAISDELMRRLTDLKSLVQPSTSHTQSRPSSPPLRFLREGSLSLSGSLDVKLLSASRCSWILRCARRPFCAPNVLPSQEGYGQTGGWDVRIVPCQAFSYSARRQGTSTYFGFIISGEMMKSWPLG